MVSCICGGDKPSSRLNLAGLQVGVQWAGVGPGHLTEASPPPLLSGRLGSKHLSSQGFFLVLKSGAGPEDSGCILILRMHMSWVVLVALGALGTGWGREEGEELLNTPLSSIGGIARLPEATSCSCFSCQCLQGSRG